MIGDHATAAPTVILCFPEDYETAVRLIAAASHDSPPAYGHGPRGFARGPVPPVRSDLESRSDR